MHFEDARNYIVNRLANDLPAIYHYHNVQHTLDVVDACKRLAAIENIDGVSTQLLLTAAFYHDSGFLIKADGHEEESCRIAREVLSRFDYNTDEIAQICGMIMATLVPQNPKNHLEQILADADVDYLGRDDFFTISDNLYRELYSLGIYTDETAWHNAEVLFLEKHRYFTSAAVNLRQLKKQANLQQIKQQLIKLKH